MPLGGNGMNKLLVIGIDGGTLDVVLPMVKEGKLPCFARLLHTGTYGTLLSTIPPVTAPAWSSFIMGTNPGKHGIFYFFDKKEQKQGETVSKIKRLVDLRQMHGLPFWEVLNNHGIKVGLINIPLTYPPVEVDGFMISGMLVPPGRKDFTSPPELLSRLENYHVDLDGLLNQNEWQGKKIVKKNRAVFLQSVFDLSKARAQNALMLMEEEKCPLFMVVFTGSDRVCHFFWQDGNGTTAPSGAVEEYYVLLDSLIDKLIQKSGPETITFLMSDHGFGPAPTKKINAYVLARQLGGTQFIPNFTLSYLKNKVFTKLGFTRRMAPEDFIDDSRSVFSPEPVYANFLGIHINDRMNERRNTASCVEEHPELKAQLIKRLENLKDPLSDKPMVKRVYTREEIYRGDFAPGAPDLVVQFSYDYKVTFSPLKRSLILEDRDLIRTGEHRREGLFIASGPGIRQGRLEEGKFSIEDVTSTILYLLGAPIPNSYDGCVIREVFEEGYLAKNEPRYSDTLSQTMALSSGNEDDFQNESDRSAELLRNLGYF